MPPYPPTGAPPAARRLLAPHAHQVQFPESVRAVGRALACWAHALDGPGARP